MKKYKTIAIIFTVFDSFFFIAFSLFLSLFLVALYSKYLSVAAAIATILVFAPLWLGLMIIFGGLFIVFLIFVILFWIKYKKIKNVQKNKK